MRKYLLLAASILTVAPAALAADLVTPEVFVGSTTNASCKIVNVSPSPVATQVQLFGIWGGKLADSGPVAIAPGEDSTMYAYVPKDVVYCRFVKVSRTKVRASFNEFSNLVGDDGSDRTVVPAS